MNETRQENPAMDMEAASASPMESTGTADTGTTAGTAEDILLPDGWTGKEFPVTDEDPLGMGPASDTITDAGTGSGNDTPQTAEEGGQQSGSEEKADGDRLSDAAPETPETPEKTAVQQEPPTGQEPDYKALWLARQEQENAEKYRNIYHDLTEKQGVPEAVAKLAAAEECGGKHYPLEESAGNGGEGQSGPASGSPAFADQINRFHKQFPDMKELPAEAATAMLRGEDPVAAYAVSQLAQRDATIAAQKREIETLRQNASNREKAVATGVSGQGMKVEAPDEFMQGFLSEA